MATERLAEHTGVARAVRVDRLRAALACRLGFPMEIVGRGALSWRGAGAIASSNQPEAEGHTLDTAAAKSM